MSVRIYVEGGGDHNKALDTECRRGFSEFFRKAGMDRRMPRIVSCGARDVAYRNFRTSHESAGDDDFPMLLVDSEAPVSGGTLGSTSAVATVGNALTALRPTNST